MDYNEIDLFFQTGLSYITHPQADPIRVTDFQDIDKISTFLQTPKSQNQQTNGRGSNNINESKMQCDGETNHCNCNEMKTLLKIKVRGNSDDLTITCNGVNAAESIADLVDGYCRIVNNVDKSFWERVHKSNEPLYKNSQSIVTDATNSASNVHSSVEGLNNENCE